MQAAEIKVPAKLAPIFDGEARYRGAYGGRGSGKTRTFALMLAVRGYIYGKGGTSGQLIAAREFMNSLADSSFEEIKQAIKSVDWLDAYYECGDRYIKSKDGRIQFTFIGLRRSLDSVKGLARILICWCDEAENISEMAWMKLIPTVREDNSEIWVTWNPESKLSATHQRFRENTPENAKIVEMNYTDNPFFPQVLEQERLEDFKKRPDLYDHIWLGDFLQYHSGAYYNVEMREAREQGRIGVVDYDKRLPVVTAWDLGYGDSTAIWFAQITPSGETRLIDYYAASSVGLDHYAHVLKSKPYVYDQHILPHDVRVHDLGSGKSRMEVLQTLGVSPVTIAPQMQVDDGIQAVRSLLPQCWFSAENCSDGIECLKQYHREWDDNNLVWKGRPKHDWTSHGADAFRYLAVGYRSRSGWSSGPIKRNLQGVA